MEFGAAFPSGGESFDVVAGRRSARRRSRACPCLDVQGALAGDDKQDPAHAALFAVGVKVVALVAEQGFGTLARTAGGRPATGGMPSTRARVWVTSLTLAAVVMTLNGVPRPSQIRWCLLPVLRRSIGDGTVSAPPFSRGCEYHPCTPVTSRVRRPRPARTAGFGAVGRRRRPAATVPGAASMSVLSRTPTTAAAAARQCRCRARTGRPGDRAGLPPAVAPVTAPTRAEAVARSAHTSRRPRLTAEYSHHHERSNRLTLPRTVMPALFALGGRN